MSVHPQVNRHSKGDYYLSIMSTNPAVISFDKSLVTRQEEYSEILGSRGPLPASRVLNEWRSHMELILEPTGWQALWKVDRITCEQLSISFPTIVLVQVEMVNFEHLVATAKTIAVQDDINISTSSEIPLQHLYPTKQEESYLDVKGTANCLDQFRFFYSHVWYPWDADEDDTADWVNDHLETRLQLHYEMRSGLVQRDTAEHICSLLAEGRSIQKQINLLLNETEMEDEDMMDDSQVQRLMPLELRKEQIRTEMQMLENPVTRNVMIHQKLQKAEEKRRNNNKDAKEVCFVWLGGSLSEFSKSLEKARNLVDRDAFVKCVQLFGDACDQAWSGDMLLLCEGVHSASGVGRLEMGGQIKGLASPEVTTLKAPSASNALLDCSASDAPLVLENLTIDARLVQTALVVRSGTVRLDNCVLVGNSSNSTQQGILVMTGGKLEAENCHFTGLGAALVINSGAQVSLNKCRLTECNFGFQVNAEANLALSFCTIFGCKEYVIRIEAHNASCLKEGTTGSLHLLDGQTNIKVESTVIKGNAKDVVMITNPTHDQLYDEVCQIPI